MIVKQMSINLQSTTQQNATRQKILAKSLLVKQRILGKKEKIERAETQAPINSLLIETKNLR